MAETERRIRNGSRLIALVARPVVAASIVGAFLLTFPAGLAIAVGLLVLAAGISLAYKRNRLAGVLLGLLVVGLVVKTPERSIVLACLIIASSVAAYLCWTKQSGFRWASWVAVALVSIVFAFGRYRDSISVTATQLNTESGQPIVCLGDSLTEGIDGGYPAELEKLLSVPVENYGRNGLTTQAAIDDWLPEILLRRPQVVVLELGGHDYKDGQPRAQTKARLQRVIADLRIAGAQVLIVEIPRGFISDPYYGLERELAADFDLPLIPDSIIRRFIFFSPVVPPGSWLSEQHHLSKDGLHPNRKGQALFAKVVADALGCGKN